MIQFERLILVLSMFVFWSCRTTSPGSLSTEKESTDSSTAAPNPLQFIEWDVRFTNPVCQSYPYDPAVPVLAVNGETLVAKPKDVFCSNLRDRNNSASRPEAPQTKLLEWINSPETTEIFFAYLSFSNKDVFRALCEAATQRGVKIRFVLDGTQDMTIKTQLEACLAPGADPSLAPKAILRGGNGAIGYAHNKIFIINPGQSLMRLAFSSGNMTSGIILHHENWNFVTVNANTYFAQSHLCLMQTQLDDLAVVNPLTYKTAINACRENITSQMGLQPETNVKVFFTPGGGEEARDLLVKGIKKADKVYVAAHRFMYGPMLGALASTLQRPIPADVSLVTDDDTYWVGTTNEQTGDNVKAEYVNIQSLVQKGAKVRWMETNHAQHLLHHNKYVVMNKNDGSWGAVFGGAGNFTGTAFGTTAGSQFPPNFENFYYIEVPEVLRRYNEQFPHMWNDLATPPERMPRTNVLPPGAL